MDLAEERRKHSILYDDSTSEIKDDVVQLVACMVGVTHEAAPSSTRPGATMGAEPRA